VYVVLHCFYFLLGFVLFLNRFDSFWLIFATFLANFYSFRLIFASFSTHFASFRLILPHFGSFFCVLNTFFPTIFQRRVVYLWPRRRVQVPAEARPGPDLPRAPGGWLWQWLCLRAGGSGWVAVGGVSLVPLERADQGGSNGAKIIVWRWLGGSWETVEYAQNFWAIIVSINIGWLCLLLWRAGGSGWVAVFGTVGKSGSRRFEWCKNQWVAVAGWQLGD
jgi:hypothetical protein